MPSSELQTIKEVGKAKKKQLKVLSSNFQKNLSIPLWNNTIVWQNIPIYRRD